MQLCHTCLLLQWACYYMRGVFSLGHLLYSAVCVAFLAESKYCSVKIAGESVQ